MKRSYSGRLFIMGIVIYCCFSLPARSAVISVFTGEKKTAVVETSEVEILPVGSELVRVKAQGAESISATGQPDIPWQVVTVLLPPNANMDSAAAALDKPQYRLLEGTWNVQPAPPSATWDKDGNPILIWPEGVVFEDGRDTAVYSTDAFWPTGVNLLSKGRMHQWQLMQVMVPLVSYHPQTGQIQELVSADVVIYYSFKGRGRSIQKGHLQRDRKRVEKLAANFSAAVADYEGGALETNTSQSKAASAEDEYAAAGVNSKGFVIITRSSIVSASSKLASFVTHKQSKGWTVSVKTEADWGGGTGPTASANIRNWLKSNYVSQDILYVLLIGNPNQDTGEVPMQWYDDGRDGGAPTDIVYADLDDDTFDSYWEVIVGRIPYYGTISYTDGILQKTIDYENAVNPLWRRNVLLPMVPLDASTPVYQCAEQIKYNLLEPRGIQSTRIYQDTYNLFPQPDHILSQKYPATAWREGQYGIVAWQTHGSQTHAADIIGNWDLSSFTNNYPSAVYEGSCQNAWPENSDNLAYSLLKKGAITTVAATRNSFYTPGQTDFTSGGNIGPLSYRYVKNMAAGQSCGLAISNAKQEQYTYTPNRMRMVMYGDPSIAVYPSEPSLAVTPTESYLVNKAVGRTFTQRFMTLKNRGASSLNWTASSSVNWLTLSQTGGSLTAGASVNLTVSTNSNADGLLAGKRTGTVTITDTTGNIAFTRQIVLNLSAAGKLAHWEFDEGSGTAISDSSGKGCAGDLINMDQSNWVEGSDITGLLFNGTDEHARIKTDLNVLSDSLTITGWIKRNGNQPSYAGLLFNRYNGMVSGMNFGSGNELRYHWNSAENTYSWSSGLVPADNTWTFVALVIESQRATMYMHNNSTLLSAVNTVTHLPAAWEGAADADALLIGYDPAGARYYKGVLDDLRVYNYPATQSEILAIRAEGIPDKTAPTPNPMTWAVSPHESGLGTVTMLASNASDPSGVEYYFDCVSGGGHDSGWQDSPSYTDSGVLTLNPEYKVKARDKSPYHTETGLSVSGLATIAPYPYGGQPRTIPGKIEAEEFDIEGEGGSYHDATAGNSGGALRLHEDVDITALTGGGYGISQIQDGEWLCYTVNTTAIKTDVHARVASNTTGGQIRVLLNSQLLATVNVPNTGSLETWQTVTVHDLQIPDGLSQELRLEMVNGGFNLQWIDFKDRQPYLGQPFAIPGKIDFKNYDIGGSLLSYYDTTPGNYLGYYRTDDVDIMESQAVYSNPGEWLEYTVNCVSGVYDLTVRSGYNLNNQTLNLTLDGQPLRVINLPKTSGWNDLRLSTVENVEILTGGQHVLRATVGNVMTVIDYVDFVRRYNRADLNRDTIVDMKDFAILSGQWLEIPRSPSADIAEPKNNVVDPNDLMILTDNWLVVE